MKTWWQIFQLKMWNSWYMTYENCMKYAILYITVMKLWMQICMQGIWISVFHILKHSHWFSMWVVDFLFSSLEHLCADIPSKNIECCVFNVWKTGIHFPTINVIFLISYMKMASAVKFFIPQQRKFEGRSDITCKLLYMLHLKLWRQFSHIEFEISVSDIGKFVRFHT